MWRWCLHGAGGVVMCGGDPDVVPDVEVVPAWCEELVVPASGVCGGGDPGGGA